MIRAIIRFEILFPGLFGKKKLWNGSQPTRAGKQQVFQLLLLVSRDTNEFNTHADSGIASAHYGAGGNLAGFYPHLDLEPGAHSKRKNGLDIASPNADV